MNIYAHRGNSGFFPENTMYAFKKSLDLGIYGIEIDVQKTKDGILVVHHDETLGRMFDGKGSIKKSTFEQLRELNLKDEELKNKADCKIPTLEEVLEFIKDTDLTLNIEIKNNNVLTTKNDSSNHGFGLQNIKDVVNKHKGEFKIAQIDGEFTLELTMNLK